MDSWTLALIVVVGLLLFLTLISSVLELVRGDTTKTAGGRSAAGAQDEEAPAQRKVVAVIGGGLSGLVCCKRFLDEGFEVVAFERSDQLGGVWVWRPGSDGKTYASLRANVHKERLQLEYFPMPKSWARYPSHWQLAEYLAAFAKHFDLPRLYRMSTEVTSCRHDDDGWTVSYRCAGAGEEAEERSVRVDAVAMCVGQACEPFAPTYPGQETFRGRIMHTVEYRGQAEFQGKRVLVVGAGAASGTDIAQDLSFGAKQVFLSVRRGIILLPRFLGGKPNAEWFERTFWNYVPLSWLFRLVTMCVSMMNTETFGTGSAEKHGIKGPSVMDTVRTRLDECKLSDWTCTDCCNLTQRVAMGAIRMKGAIERFEETGVRFQDGSFEEVDAVIWATGFKRDCTGLGCNVGRQGEETKKLRLWRSVWHPSLPNFACCLQTHPYGSHWAVADAEVRWIASVFAGRVALPDAKRREKEAAEVAEHQSQDTVLDTVEVARVAKNMGMPRPGYFRLLGLLVVKPRRTLRFLRQLKTSRRFSVDECAEPFSDTCLYETAL
mmetsp:Transcript_22880/g.52750  ORF Transcript_22880/g.52750 Transcript_22880/m.52750 type:complete len:548 (+) Transcript_22880:62-1705(+)